MENKNCLKPPTSYGQLDAIPGKSLPPKNPCSWNRNGKTLMENRKAKPWTCGYQSSWILHPGDQTIDLPPVMSPYDEWNSPKSQPLPPQNPSLG